MKVNFYELKGKYGCQRRRNYNLPISKEKNSPNKEMAAMQKAILIDALSGKLEGGIQETVHSRMPTFEGMLSKTAEILEKDASMRIQRCLDSFMARSNEWAVLTDLPEASCILSGTEIEIADVRPDLIVKSSEEGVEKITAYYIKSGKPEKADETTYTVKDLSKDLQAYALLQYAAYFAEQIYLSGRCVEIEAGFLFMRKNSDKNATPMNPEGHFDEDIFVNDKGKRSGNVMLLASKIEVGSGAGMEIPSPGQYSAAVKEYLQGISPESCTDTQCRDCEFREICHYVHTPEEIQEVETEVSVPSNITLNGVQEEIRQFRTGYAIVNAVPGAGKTLVLALRVVELINTGVKPEEIAVITFTNAGADVFRKRIAKYNAIFGSGEPVDSMTAVTFNSFGQSILEDEYRMFGFTKPPRVIDPIERSQIISSILEKESIEGLDYRNFEIDMKNYKGALAVASECFRLLKQYGWDEEIISQKLGHFCSIETARSLSRLYRVYCGRLKKENLIEYSDQENLLLELLGKEPYYFEKYGFRHILVDECQDTSEAQFKILKHMAIVPSFESLMVVGDDSQSIYGFRDTTPKFFIDFENTMKLAPGEARVFYMADNFRSTPEIINFANALISLNRVKVNKEICSKKASGKPVVVKGFDTSDEEYEWIVKEISQQIAGGKKPEDIAFIAFTRTELDKIEALLNQEGIQSVMLIPERYLDNSRVRAAIALSREFLAEPSPTPDIDRPSQNVLVYLNALLDGGLLVLGDGEIVEGSSKLLKEIMACKEGTDEEKKKNDFLRMLETININDEIYSSFLDILKRKQDLQSILNYCMDFARFGEKAEKRREIKCPGVVLTTAHSSKGMEFDTVFNSVSKYDNKDLIPDSAEMEERRRLLYVSATRAKEELYITGKYIAYGGKECPSPNQFLREAFECAGEPSDILEMVNV